MATINTIDSGIPIEITKGGTQNSSLTSFAVICGGTTSTGALQSVASVGTLAQVLTSNGAGNLPTFQDASTTVFFPTLANDPGSPEVGQVWFNTTENAFKGARNASAVVTFQVV